jgi:2-furoyl-CoA dehydrogenase large subunit
VDIAEASEAGAPVLHEAVGSNVVNERFFRYGDPEQAFAGASRRVALTVHYPRNSCTPIECGVVVAEHQPEADGGHAYEVLSNFMGPFSLHSVMRWPSACQPTSCATGCRATAAAASASSRPCCPMRC